MLRTMCWGMLLALASAVAAGTPEVTAVRLPGGRYQPQVAVDGAGGVHLLTFVGDAKGGDLLYSKSTDSGRTFSEPIRVNSQPGSVIAAGTVRGGQIAVGRGNRPHVAWMGSATATPRAPGNANRNTPLLYSRLNDAGDGFEPQRNVIARHVGLDGGLSVAADREGNVYAVWHAPEMGKQGEEYRQVWVARSTDDGKTFAAETAAEAEAGICGCCGMRAFCDSSGRLHVVYRSAREMVHRDMYLLTSADHGATFTSAKLDSMNIPKCVMSTTMLAERPAGGLLVTWETNDRVFFAPVEAGAPPHQVLAPVVSKKPAKHSAIAVNSAGQILLAWTEGTAWQKGGAVAWQVFDRDGNPLPGASGRREDLPVWSLPAAVARPDGGFAIFY